MRRENTMKTIALCAGFICLAAVFTSAQAQTGGLSTGGASGSSVATNNAVATVLDGRSIYAKKCATCHQATGAGIAGAFPALKGSAYVQGESNAVLITVLKGRGGMPTFAAALNDEQLAAVLTYVRQSWGNKASAVTPIEAQAIRAQGAGPALHQPGVTNVH